MIEIKVGIVEDQMLFREGICSILENWSDMIMVFQSPDGYSVSERLEKSDQIPDVMLIDLSLPPHGGEEYNGWRVVEMLGEYYPEMGKIILSAHDDEFTIATLIEKGADGYLLKDCDPDELHEAIVRVYQRGSYINARALSAIQKKLKSNEKSPKDHGELSAREVEVLKLVCQQMTTDEIAEKLFLSPKTVNGHRNNLLQKTGSKNVTGLVMYAVKHHLVDF